MAEAVSVSQTVTLAILVPFGADGCLPRPLAMGGQPAPVSAQTLYRAGAVGATGSFRWTVQTLLSANSICRSPELDPFLSPALAVTALSLGSLTIDQIFARDTASKEGT